MIDYNVLLTELNGNHPITGTPYSANANTAAGQLNTKNVPTQRDTLSASDIFESIDLVQYNALTATQKAQVQQVLNLGDTIKVGPSSKARAFLLDAFPSGNTFSALVAAVTVNISRAEQGFGVGTVISIGDVERARLGNG